MIGNKKNAESFLSKLVVLLQHLDITTHHF